MPWYLLYVIFVYVVILIKRGVSNDLKFKQDARQALTRATCACVCKSTPHNVLLNHV